MSADNGIYILETKETVGPRYRVAHGQNIEDIYSKTVSHWQPEEQQGINLPAVWSMFRDSRVFLSSAAADEAADAMLAQLTVCEYGIEHITLDCPFPGFTEVLAFAVREVDDAFSQVCNDDQPVTGRELCAVRFSLGTVLLLMEEKFERIDNALGDLKSPGDDREE